MARHNFLGSEGEKIAAEFLENKGFEIVSVNFRRPYGEIDIISRETSGEYRFIEVKTVSWETAQDGVPHETYRPEENMHPMKAKRLMRVIQAYIAQYRVEDWQFDVIAVFLDQKKKLAKVRHLENVILGT